jgi:hypothetical protein
MHTYPPGALLGILLGMFGWILAANAAPDARILQADAQDQMNPPEPRSSKWQATCVVEGAMCTVVFNRAPKPGTPCRCGDKTGLTK